MNMIDRMKTKQAKDKQAKKNSDQTIPNYNKGLWNKAQLRVAIKKGVITAEEFEATTGEKF